MLNMKPARPMTQSEVAALQAQYPLATRWVRGREHTEDYCVGYALCAAAQMDKAPRYPVPALVLDACLRLNPSLWVEAARQAADTIVYENDQGRIATAWEVARRVLTSQGTFPALDRLPRTAGTEGETR
jgi:hypothetical protein